MPNYFGHPFISWNIYSNHTRSSVCDFATFSICDVTNLHPKDYGLHYRDIQIKTVDSLQLHGYSILPETDQVRGAIIAVHGIGSCKEQFLDLAKQFSQKGIVSYLFDSRAHGVSEGNYCTYGFFERMDISKIVDQIKKEYPEIPIGIIGNSMGGAIALQSMEYDKRIDFGIIESTFTKLDQVVYDYKKRLLYGFGIKFLSDIALDEAGKIAGFDPNFVQPIESAKRIEQPVFIAHGDKDQNISYTYGKSLFENLKTLHKKFVLVKGAHHLNLHKVGGISYSKQLFLFIENQITDTYQLTNLQIGI